MSKATDDNWPTMQHWWGAPDELDEHLRELVDKYIDITGDDGSWDGCQTWVNDWFWQARQEVKNSTFTKWLRHAKGTETPN